MHLIVCVDDNMGMAFGGRRQSRDRVLRDRILEITAGKPLWMNAYSAKQFGEVSNVCVAEDFLQKAVAGEFCFAETVSPAGTSPEKIILYRWNRSYPGDLYFTLPQGWRMTHREEFAGFSHEVITEEVYEP